jgi:protein SCO1/2
MWRTALLLLVVLVAIAGCGKPAPEVNSRQFPLTGEIVAIKVDRTEITVKHDEVKDFMAAMTMPFAIKDPAQLDGLATGDLITATLVVTDEESYLAGIRKTGSAPRR